MPDPFANLPVRTAAQGRSCPTCGDDAIRYVAYYHGLTHCLVRCGFGHWFIVAVGGVQPPSHPPAIRVLVVEPDDALRELYCVRLASEFLDVTAVRTGGEAVRDAFKSHPGVVTTELTLPDGDALDWCRQLKRSAGAWRPAILIVTREQRSDRLADAANVADAVLLKPCVPDVYLREVLRLGGFEPTAAAGRLEV